MAQQRDSQVRAVLVRREGDFASVSDSVPINLRRHALAGPAARQLAESAVLDSRVPDCRLPASRLHPVARWGAPCAVLAREANGSDLLVVGAGQTVVHGYPVLGRSPLAASGRAPFPSP